MLVELGPVPTADVVSWTRFARRLIVELRSDPDDLDGIVTDDFLKQWTLLINSWSDECADKATFRWSETLDNEVAEYLVHGFERCIHSESVQARVTDEEIAAQRSFTVQIIRAFVTGLSAEGTTQQHLVDQIRTSFGGSVDL